MSRCNSILRPNIDFERSASCVGEDRCDVWSGTEDSAVRFATMFPSPRWSVCFRSSAGGRHGRTGSEAVWWRWYDACWRDSRTTVIRKSLPTSSATRRPVGSDSFDLTRDWREHCYCPGARAQAQVHNRRTPRVGDDFGV